MKLLFATKQQFSFDVERIEMQHGRVLLVESLQENLGKKDLKIPDLIFSALIGFMAIHIGYADRATPTTMRALSLDSTIRITTCFSGIGSIKAHLRTSNAVLYSLKDY